MLTRAHRRLRLETSLIASSEILWAQALAC